MQDQNNENRLQEEITDPRTGSSGDGAPAGAGGIKGWMNSIPYRSCAIMAVAGAYLIYLGYGLIRDTAAGVEGSSLAFGIAGGLFVLLGGLMLVVAANGYFRFSDEKKKKEAAEAAEKAVEEEQKEKEEPKDPPKKMSIAERASLADRISGEDSDS